MTQDTQSRPSADVPKDKQLIDNFVGYLIRVMMAAQVDGEVPSATLEVIRKVCQDNAITISSVRRGEFGSLAKQAAEDFPFDDSGQAVAAPMMGIKPN